jgi:hypothetical protein
MRELAMFNLGVDSKLLACDLTNPRLRDVCRGDRVGAWAIVLQREDSASAMQFEITPPTRWAVEAWI